MLPPCLGLDQKSRFPQRVPSMKKDVSGWGTRMNQEGFSNCSTLHRGSLFEGRSKEGSRNVCFLNLPWTLEVYA